MRRPFPPVERFRRFPFWMQVVITLGSAAVLVAGWSACGVSPAPPPPAPPLSVPRAELRGKYGGVNALAFSPAGEWLAAATNDKIVRLWDVSKSEVIHTMKGHRGPVTSLAVSPDGRILATGSVDKTVRLWDTSTGNEIRTLAGHSSRITTVAFSPGGRWLASAADEDESVRLWDASSSQQLRVISAHKGGVNAIAFSSDGRLLASAGNDKAVRLWDPQTGKLVRALDDFNTRVIAVAFSPDSRILATGTAFQLGIGLSGTQEGQIRFWNVETGALVHSFHSVLGRISCLAFSPDGKTLASATEYLDYSTNSKVTLWFVNTHTVQSEWDAERSKGLNAIAFSADGRWLASGGDSGRIRLWQ